MSIHRIVLFYEFTPVADPEAVRLWQRALCEQHGLTGRIIISRQGINATVGGELAGVKQYVKTTREYFQKIDVKWSEGSAADFPRLSVRVRDELVSFGAAGEVEVDEQGVVDGGVRLSPEQLHQLLESKDVVFFDGRNSREARIGKFKDAIVPETSTTRDFVAELDSGAYDDLKDRPVVTYCTGGIRCEVLTALMRRRGFSEVYQLDGGIVRYGEQYRDGGLWQGSLYVFDGRGHIQFSEEAEVIGRCSRCAEPTNDFHNCAEPSCRALDLYCSGCVTEAEARCAMHTGKSSVPSAS